MLIDLHCHTRLFSSCSSLEPATLVVMARDAGLQAICLTEHDRTWTDADLHELSTRLDFPMFRGMEITTELGHVLVFGLDRFEPNMYFATSLRRHVLDAGGLMALAHPVRAGQPAVDLGRHADLFDFVEGLNGSDGAAQNTSAARLGAVLTLPPIAGSDCHAPHEVGTVATVLARAVRDERELVAELRRGLHHTVDLRIRRSAVT